MSAARPTQVLFIHGGGGEDGYKADQKLADSLQAALGSDYSVIYFLMPDADNPTYEAWKDEILTRINVSQDPMLLVGHSFGASILLKVLAQETVITPIKGLFLIAPPYWGLPDWEVDDYALEDDFASHLPQDLPLFLYHNRDDDVVSVDHLDTYAAKLPHATRRTFDKGGHQFNDDLSEVAADIKRLSPEAL